MRVCEADLHAGCAGGCVAADECPPESHIQVRVRGDAPDAPVIFELCRCCAIELASALIDEVQSQVPELLARVTSD